MNSQTLFNNLLVDTANAILPHKDEIQEQSKIVNDIKLLLESESVFGISKAKPAGSVGKATTIISSDVDVVFFIRNVQPPFEDVNEEFVQILRDFAQNNSEYNVENIRRTRHSIQFSINNYEFDLLPAIDFAHENHEEPEHVSQQKQTLQKIKEHLHQDWSGYSSSLTFSTVQFMKKQSALAHEMARLAKFWFRSAHITEYVYGAKYAMELIAVKACEGVVERHHNENVHLMAFQKFLGMVEYFEDLDIIFEEEYLILDGHQPAQDRAKPSVLDPANPYNNLARAFSAKPNAIKALKMHVKRTFSNFRGMRWDDDVLKNPNFTFWRIINIFSPDLFCEIRTAARLFGACTQSELKQYKPIEIRVDVTRKARKQIEFMQICLTAVCKKAPGNDLQERLIMVYKTKHPSAIVEYSPNERHEDRNVTICLKTDNLGAAIFSFNVLE